MNAAAPSPANSSSTDAIRTVDHSFDTLGSKAWRKLKSQRQVMICLGIIVVYILIALAQVFSLLPDFQERVGSSYQSPELFNLPLLFGTDIFGRSVLYKILAGTSTAMTIGFAVAGIALPIGLFLGMCAAYYGGKVDAAIVWLYSVIVSVPSLLLIVAISYVLGKGIVSVCVALGLVYWVGLCRLVRGEVLKHKESEYVMATRLLGGSDMRILFKHILPNVIHLAIVTGSLLILQAIKSEVILTYIGVGVQSGASWGQMIAAAPGEITSGHYWPLLGVVLFMFAIIYSLNVVGDALRDALDPKLLN